MKSCPYCKEDVRDDAIKCRYCQSSLLPSAGSAAASPGEDRRVTYVVDTDLVRFAKFAVAVLAVFLVVGAYLYGFKLEASLDKMQNLQKDFETTTAELNKSRTEFQSAKLALTNLKTEVETMLGDAKATLLEIQNQNVIATREVAYFLSMKKNLTLSVTEQAIVVQRKKAEPDEGRKNSKYWTVGSTLRIKFLGGTSAQQADARLALLEWGKFTNLKFNFVTTGSSEIRVAFEPTAGSWSYLGTDALAVPQHERTANFGFPTRSALLHEWGHALGLIEEPQNPKANIKWDMDRIVRELSGPPNYWSKETIDMQFAKMSPEKLGEYRDFDPLSVMNIEMPPTWTGGLALGGKTQLSASDKELIQRLYPRAR
ncbi:hypothetical protein QTH90_13415 [Variovorax sp. J2P1-59]|uniref:zinc ribbon domain-containing protein n=1 Tax=Variovorax flavidus TaxID=3053501 RepID=UPI0025751F07|nr:hypothetical protein [Variovorax sp. J2P1-59]MDM0075393.1 hypothetical protein [Variovorax sp. J2P1-59]